MTWTRALNAIKWTIKRLGILALVILGAVGLLLSSLWIEHHVPLTLPTPTGSFAVGRETRSWIGQQVSVASADTTRTGRTVFAWIWYPAVDGEPPAPTEDYIPDPWRKALEASGSVLFNQLLYRDLSRVSAHSLRDRAVSPARSSYPVIIFRGGLSTQAVEYSALAEDLASHGYVVVGIDAPYRTRVFIMPDGRVIKRSDENNPDIAAPADALRHMLPKMVNEWVADVAFTLDQLERLDISDPTGTFTSKLDLARVGVVGHSLGGATAAQFCLNDSRCKVGIDIDGLVMASATLNTPKTPFMFLMSDHSKDDPNDPVDQQIVAWLDAAFQHFPPESRVWLAIRGANHYNFSDGAVVKSHIAMSILRLVGVVGMDGRRQLAITAYCVQAFLDKHLATAPTAAPPTPESLFSEIEIQR